MYNVVLFFFFFWGLVKVRIKWEASGRQIGGKETACGQLADPSLPNELLFHIKIDGSSLLKERKKNLLPQPGVLWLAPGQRAAGIQQDRLESTPDNLSPQSLHATINLLEFTCLQQLPLQVLASAQNQTICSIYRKQKMVRKIIWQIISQAPCFSDN